MGNYNEYLIKDGKFIGEFEKMYQDCEDPWHQLEQADISYSRADTSASISKYGIRNIIEIGCGLGAFTNFLYTHCGSIESIIGIDVSKTAVEKAKRMYPDLSFYVRDIAELCSWGNDERFTETDAIILSEILWYVLENLDSITKQLKSVFSGKILIINQTFYKEGQKYGTEYFTTQDEMIEYMPFKLIARTSGNDISKGTIETHSVFVIE